MMEERKQNEKLEKVEMIELTEEEKECMKLLDEKLPINCWAAAWAWPGSSTGGFPPWAGFAARCWASTCLLYTS